MKTYFYLNDNATTRKELKNTIGENKLQELVDFARNLYHKSRTTTAEKYYIAVNDNMVAIEFVG